MRCTSALFVTVCAGLLASTAQASVLVNPGFETGTAPGNGDFGGSPGWITFGNVFTVSTPNPAPVGPRSGTGALKQFGTFPGVSGAFQVFPASAGEQWSLSGYGLNSSADAMQAENFALLKIAFKNAANAEIGFAESAFITNATVQDQWHALSANGVAPAGTVTVELFALFVQPNFNGGAAFFDDLAAVPSPASLALLGMGGLVMARRRRA
ncbi:MAG: PEP-CTERM sorting domain-containing protein [Planctomycetota bacterium]|nr:PEP-CTERM sorting domain-containing protein [Planctomycetota bacterium]